MMLVMALPLDNKYLPLPKTSNSALALFENPIFSPSINTIQPDADSSIPGEQNTIHDLAFHAVDLELPLTVSCKYADVGSVLYSVHNLSTYP